MNIAAEVIRPGNCRCGKGIGNLTGPGDDPALVNGRGKRRRRVEGYVMLCGVFVFEFDDDL